MSSRLIKPGPLRLPPPAPTLGASFSLIHTFRTFKAQGHRAPFLFPSLSGPIDVIFVMKSDAARRSGWIRAGIFAQVLDVGSIDPVARTERAFFGENFYRFESLDQSFFLDFWAYRWISDYQLQIHARQR